MWTLTLKKTRSKKEAVKVILDEEEMEEVAEWVEEQEGCSAGDALIKLLAEAGATKMKSYEVNMSACMAAEAHSEEEVREQMEKKYPDFGVDEIYLV